MPFGSCKTLFDGFVSVVFFGNNRFGLGVRPDAWYTLAAFRAIMHDILLAMHMAHSLHETHVKHVWCHYRDGSLLRLFI